MQYFIYKNSENDSNLMAPKLREIEKLNKGPKPRNAKEKVEWLGTGFGT